MWTKFCGALRSVRAGYSRMTAIERGYLNKRIFSPMTFAASSITTTPTLNDGKVPFDPILDIVFEDYMNKVNEQEAKKLDCKMLTQDPPVSVKDIDGNPVEPIDINPWADPDELSNLFGNSNFLRRKLLTHESDQSNEPVKDIIRVVDEMRTLGGDQIDLEELLKQQVLVEEGVAENAKVDEKKAPASTEKKDN